MSEEQKKSNSSFLLQGAILAAAGIITRLIGLAYRRGDTRTGLSL